MSATIKSLNPLDFPLSGSHLIEASAGTGKTFTIAALYLRLILGHGDSLAFKAGQALTPPEILVVTFTDAATQELRDRIRARLTEAAAYFQTDPEAITPPGPGGELLYDLRATYAPSQWSDCAHQLQLASEWMDEAAVSTIHGWCNRMLREHAFDSQSLFTQNLETDTSELFAEIVRDYWRNHFYALETADLIQVREYWKHPGDLATAVKALVEHVDLLKPPSSPVAHLQAVRDAKQARLKHLKAPWPEWSREIKALLDGAVANNQVDRKRIQARWYDPWLATIEAWSRSDSLESFDIGSGWSRLTPSGIKEVSNPGCELSHPGFDAISTLQQALCELPKPKQGLLSHAARWINQAFDSAQRKTSQMGFNDLLTHLDSALNGEHGDRLAQVIRQQFPVALIDEFQDTDPVQYRIFDRIYRVGDNRPDSALILIGDPKQAIYAFRGADIYTYLKARSAVQDRLYTLATNFRSTQAMVEAVNHCFNFNEQRLDTTGAFMFRQHDQNPLPFQTVLAQGRKDQFVSGDEVPPALILATLNSDEIISKTDYLQHLSEICATQIVSWLNGGQRQHTGFLSQDGSKTPLKPGDIAILVNNANEARHIRQALSRRSVRSVYLSDKESIYSSRSANEIYRWLSACAEPDNDLLLRAALSTVSLGLSFAELDALNHDEEIWENRVLQFKAYREIWHRQGVLPMLRTLLFDFGCIERLLQMPIDAAGLSGERILTDLLHLAELLQQASYSLEGEHALIRFLAEQQASPLMTHETQKIRLESDADLVKVVTIFKSKGLEYPVVCLPFLCATRRVNPSDLPLKWHDAKGNLTLSLESSETALVDADRERFSEDIRKVYVALTRARYLTWVGLAALKDTNWSAIAYLMGLEEVSAEHWPTAVKNFAGTQPSIAVISDLSVNHETFQPVALQNANSKARIPVRAAREAWWISSYSALKTENKAFDALPTTPIHHDTPQAENLHEAQQQLLPPGPVEAGAKEPVHRFPRGAEAGTLLHELMEYAANQGFQSTLDNPVLLRQNIERRCQNRQWQAWTDYLLQWIIAMIQTPFPLERPPATTLNWPESISLRTLERYKVEMEFWFETHHVDLERLDAVVTQYTLAQRPRPQLKRDVLHGMLKGFMDLVFEYQGRYYVADYKSNWLGPHNASYNHDNMEEAIRNHRYDLQYVIYLFALHRLLKSRLADYDYDQHIGGAMYLFMRGIGATSAGVHFERPCKRLMDELEAIFTGNQERSL